MTHSSDSLAALISGVSAAVTVIAASYWWIFLQGKASGRMEATLEALQRAQVNTGTTLQDIAERLKRLEDKRGGKRLRWFQKWFQRWREP